MKPFERRRALRVPFVASATIIDVASERPIFGRISDLSVHGCFVATEVASLPGTRLWITIVYLRTKLAVLGNVVHAQKEGIGVNFIKLEMNARVALDHWIAKQRSMLSARHRP